MTTLAPVDVVVTYSAGRYIATARGKRAARTTGAGSAALALARGLDPSRKARGERVGDDPADPSAEIWRIHWQPRS